MLSMKLVILASACAAVSATAYCADHCSLKVIVRTSEGYVPATPVTVTLNSTGRTLKKNNQADGVTFCDLGIVPVKVVVGHNCNQAVLNNVQLTWGEMRVVRAIYDPCTVRERVPSPDPACEMLLMIRDEAGDPIPGARVEVNSPVKVSFTADAYGRVLTGFRYGSVVDGSVHREGFEGRPMKIECTASAPTIETEVLLRRVR